MTETLDWNLSTQALAELPLFQGSQPKDLEWVIPACTIRIVPPGRVLLSPDQFHDRVYVVLDGQIQVQLDAAGERVVAALGVGHCVGEMSALERVPPSATAVTVTDCRLLVLEGETLRAAVDRSTVVARNLLRILARRVRTDNLLVNASLEQNKQLELHARIDGLTGLYNRRWLDTSLATLLARAERNGTPLSLLMLDIDHFKRYNDLHGHLAGDRVLAAVARAVRNTIRSADYAARFGGEELAVVLPEARLDDARALAERVRGAVREASLHDATGASLPHPSVSIGVAEWMGGERPEQLLGRADAALYRAKQGGRDRVSM